MGVAEWFSSFCSNLQVQSVDSISSRYKTITRRLNTDFWSTTSDTAHSLYVGSYGRNTAIHGFSDLDIVFELPVDVYHRYNAYALNGQSALLQAVRTSMQKTYPNSYVKGDGQVVGLNFTDGISFEIVPVFTNTAGSYTFPDSNGGGSWRTTNPRPEIEAIRTRNNACNKNLVPLCRMMRSWKTKWNVPMGGLLIDGLAHQFIDTWQYKDRSYLYYDFMCRDFFEFLAGQSRQQSYWKAPGSGQHVYGGGFQTKASSCYSLALEAIAHESATPTKREWSAKQKWREIFGTSFPD